jgi:hypothetical protein
VTLRAKLIRLAHENPSLRGDLLPLLKKASVMGDREFWKLTEPYGWGTKTTDSKVIKKSLMGKLSLDEAEALEDAFRALSSKLYKALMAYEAKSGDDFGLGDDGFGDLIAHIIGMGKKEYEAVLKNPDLAMQRAHKSAFKESFSYSLPSKHDYESLNISKYLEWAKRIISEYSQVLNASEDDVPWKAKLEVPLKKVISVMEDFVREESVSALLEEEDETRKASEEADKILSKLRMGMSLPDEGTLEHALKQVSNKWFVWNMFTDVRDFMT